MRGLVLAGLVFAIQVALSVATGNGTHWIVIPDKFTPGVPLPLTFSFYNTTDDITVQVDLIRDDHSRTSSLRHTFKGGKSEILQIAVPNVNPNPSTYTLLIYGLGGVFFQDHGIVHYDSGDLPETFAVHIQTDKGVYKPGETIRFRTFGISSDMMVYTGLFNIHIEDPKGNTMKNLVNVSESEYGVVEDFLIMDTEPVLGKWKIVSTALNYHTSRSQVSQTVEFTVDKYVLPKFEVTIQLPPYVVTKDQEMHGVVKAKYTYGKPVIGTVKLYADVDYYDTPWKYHGDEVMVESSFDIDGEAKFTVPFSRITNEVDPNSFQPLVEKLAGYHLVIKASVTESINNITRNASAQVLFYQEPYRMSFDTVKSMSFFKPGLPYVGHITVTQANGNPMISNEEIRLVSYVKFYDESTHRYRAQYLAEQRLPTPPTGSLEFIVDPPVNTSSLHLEAYYQGLHDTMNVNKPYWLLDEGNVQLTLNTSSVVVGKPVTFDIKRADNLYHTSLFYAVIANDRMVHSGVVSNNMSNDLQISFQVTDQMKPYSKIIIYYFDTDVWNADALYFDVHEDAEKFKNKVAISFNQKQAEPGENVSLAIVTDPLSLVNLLAVDQSVLLLAKGNDITQSGVIASLKSGPHASDDSSSLHDPKTVMQTAGFQVISDVINFDWLRPFHRRQVDCYPVWVPGMIPTPAPGSTYAPDKIPTPAPGGSSGSALQEVKHTRENFPETWLWSKLTVGPSGNAVLDTVVPDTITSWYATAFSVNKNSGLGVTESAAKFTTFRPFFVSLNLPYSVIRGEQVVLQANVFNYMGQDLDVVVTVEQSNDFDIIVNTSGLVTFESKDVVQTIHIMAGQAESVFVPIVAHIVGVAHIAVKAQTALSADRVIRELIVEAEGKKMHFNIPFIINQHSSMDIPLGFPPSFVVDSEKIQVSAIGDTMGPTVKNLKSLLRMPTGCGEQTMASLAPDVFVYNYLKKSHKLTKEIEDMALNYMYKGYQRELTFQHSDGSFSIWGERDSTGSMWLTAFVLKSFHQASEHIYVYDSVMYRAASWILRFQNYDGSFREQGSVHSTSLRGGSDKGYSLTAFVAIALAEAEPSLLRYQFSTLSNAIVRTRTYLENAVRGDHVTNAYDLAIVSYALSKTGSAYAYQAYSKLDRLATVNGGKKYWSVQYAQVQPYYPGGWLTSYQQSPPLQIEVAAYALLYLISSNQHAKGFDILQWLVGQRNSMGGFRSTQDTVLGLQAMSEYGAMFSDPLNLDIDVSAGNFHRQIHIGQNEAMVLKLVDIPYTAFNMTHSNPNSAVSLQGQGSGSALVQVSVSFNVETEVAMPAFNITTTIVKETLRSIVVQTCARYLPERYIGPGMAVIEVDLPSGFTADLESSETNIAGSRNTEIRDDKTVVLYYDQILPTYPRTCATIEMIRTDLVAKTKPSAIRVYDYYEPDNRALAFFESKLLKDSTFCDICTTCQC